LPAQGGLVLNIPLLESRVTSLESLMADLIEVSYRTQRNVDQLSLEMRDFKYGMVEGGYYDAPHTRRSNQET